MFISNSSHYSDNANDVVIEDGKNDDGDDDNDDDEEKEEYKDVDYHRGDDDECHR